VADKVKKPIELIKPVDQHNDNWTSVPPITNNK